MVKLEHDAPACPRCKMPVGTPIKEAGQDRWEGPPNSTLFCPGCGCGWVGTEAEFAHAIASWNAYEATLPEAAR